MTFRQYLRELPVFAGELPTFDPGAADSRETLELSTKESLVRLEREPDLVVPEWTLYGLRPDQVEFWQADKDRRHTRLRYDRSGDAWTRQLLWP
jgi:pyridoxamine 5'-phosphate oxidase